MRNFRKWIGVPIIIAVAVCLLILLDFLLYPCTFTRNDMHAVLGKTSDDLYLGASHGKSNIDPASVQKVSGRTGHNFCTGGQYAIDSFYLTKLMLEKGHAPKRIVYEVSPGYFTSEKEEGNNYLLFYHEFPVSRSRLSYFRNAVARCNIRTMFFPWYEYDLSESIGKIPETARRKWKHDYSTEWLKGENQAYYEDGFIEYYPRDLNDPEQFTLDGFSEMFPSDIKETNMEYLDRLIRLCEEHDIEFVAVITPLPEETIEAFSKGYDELDQYFKDFFASREVRFINFNDDEHYDLTGHARKYFTDLDGHMNGNAARAFSQVLASQLDPGKTDGITWDKVIEEYDTEDEDTEDDGTIG